MPTNLVHRTSCCFAHFESQLVFERVQHLCKHFDAISYNKCKNDRIDRVLRGSTLSGCPNTLCDMGGAGMPITQNEGYQNHKRVDHKVFYSSTINRLRLNALVSSVEQVSNATNCNHQNRYYVMVPEKLHTDTIKPYKLKQCDSHDTNACTLEYTTLELMTDSTIIMSNSR